VGTPARYGATPSLTNLNIIFSVGRHCHSRQWGLGAKFLILAGISLLTSCDLE